MYRARPSLVWFAFLKNRSIVLCILRIYTFIRRLLLLHGCSTLKDILGRWSVLPVLAVAACIWNKWRASQLEGKLEQAKLEEVRPTHPSIFLCGSSKILLHQEEKRGKTTLLWSVQTAQHSSRGRGARVLVALCLHGGLLSVRFSFSLCSLGCWWHRHNRQRIFPCSGFWACFLCLSTRRLNCRSFADSLLLFH